MSISQPLQPSDLIFSTASSSLKIALGELKRSNLSIKNRLRSIRQDAEFVCQVADAYQFPLVANERCGSWYIPPDRKAGSSYFKSTDGHFGQWAFSLRRLNLQVLDIIGKGNGCIIVDSTRRGKVMPDALSKTVPIWVNVMNRLLFPENNAGSIIRLSAPLYAVSESEYTQISARLDAFVNDASALRLDLGLLRQKLKGKPMKLTWIRPHETLPAHSPVDEKHNLIVLCTASNQTSHETSATSEYVQGAADDPESWSLGLDAAMFWENQQELLATSEDDLPMTIETIMTASKDCVIIEEPAPIKPTDHIFIGSNALAETRSQDFHTIFSCTTNPNAALSTKLKDRYVVLDCSNGKVGSRKLRKELERHRERLKIESSTKVLVACDTGKDLAVGAALALICLSYDDVGVLRGGSEVSTELSGKRHLPAINKMIIKQKLSWIMSSMPNASPSRATLQSVNAFLMG